MMRLQLWSTIVILFIASLYGWGTWNRFDAVREYKEKLRAATAEQRLDHIEEDRKRDLEIDNLDDAELRDRAAEWMLP